MVRFSPANSKLKKLYDYEHLAKWLIGGRKVYSFDILSGWTCPAAQDCHSKVVIKDGARKIEDGPLTEFRCYSASLELIYSKLYDLRLNNWQKLKSVKTTPRMFSLLKDALPKNAGICRIHSGGDFFNLQYFDAWLRMAKEYNDVLFYGYTKMLPFWIKRRRDIGYTRNLVLTASYGGKYDHLIKANRLRFAQVVGTQPEGATEVVWNGKTYEIDRDDSHAADPKKRRQSFALEIHGVQPAGKLYTIGT